MPEEYVLATGDEGIERLRVVDGVHGADTRAILQTRLGVGMHVADVGCGAGIVTAWIADQVGATGRVVGIDASPAQIATAQKLHATPGRSCIEFVAANAYSTGFESDYFDLVFSRFMLMHLREPGRALYEMHRILKPGGTLIIEDGDFTTPFCWPQSSAYDRCFELYRHAGEQQGEDFLIGRKLCSLVREAGFSNITAGLVQPVLFDDAEARRLPRWTLEESAASLVRAGLTTAAEIERLCKELEELEEAGSTLFAMARVTQVCATKQAVSDGELRI